jgi:hypothetical protein
MTVETTDYTPEGKTLSDCSPAELMHTVLAIRQHGMLRMHAAERLMNRINDELESRKLGLFTYEDNGTDPDDKGMVHAIGPLQDTLRTDDHHHVILIRNVDRQYRVLTVNGPFSKVRAEVRAFCDAPSRHPKVEPLDLSKGPVVLPSGTIVGMVDPFIP